jgi:hypothetical protein
MLHNPDFSLLITPKQRKTDAVKTNSFRKADSESEGSTPSGTILVSHKYPGPSPRSCRFNAEYTLLVPADICKYPGGCETWVSPPRPESAKV